MDDNLRKKWMEAIHNDILSPLYFANIENFPYNENNPFRPNYTKVAELRMKDFSAFSYPKAELREYILHIFYDLLEPFHIEICKMQRFIYAVCENYQDNPFHNIFHAFSVLQMIHSIGEHVDKYQAYLDNRDRLALLISSYGHDLNHPGVTNAFMINSRHSLAIRYNDISVLENHHAATLVHFLELEGCDIFCNLPNEDQTYMRRLIIPTILATDMARHKIVMENFAQTMQNFNRENPTHRQHLLDMVLHSADVGNPTYKFDLATVWSLRIIQEFNKQVLQEEERGLPVSEFLRVGNEIKKIKQNQMGFIDAVIYPLWKLLNTHIPQTQEYVESIERNRKMWEELEKL
ncbi:unnamed protein product [Blepharisma stoltei]|uniref:PDEase domain-containing protein n=1 Tax=Blepharisma stoltei TaxID=1481888 RepID=A0AAU9JJZ9_9CILI|nr:unnamed protein product [Blepharisma stoltei]